MAHLRLRRSCLLVYCILVFACAPRSLAADPAPPPGESADLTLAAVAEGRSGLQKELAGVRSSLAKLPEGGPKEAALWLTQETALLERIDGVYAELARTLQHYADLQREEADVLEQEKSRRPPDVLLKPPYSLQLLDQLYGEQEYLTQAHEWLATDIGNAEEALQEARDAREDRDRERRQVREVAATHRDPAEAQRQLRVAELECRLAQETAKLRGASLRTLRFQESLVEPKARLLKPKLEWLRDHVVITEEEIAGAAAAREKRRMEVEAALEAARADAQAVSLLVVETERRPAGQVSAEELASRRADRQLADRTVSVLTAQREYLTERGKVMQQRREVLSGTAARGDMVRWDAENRVRIDRVERDRTLQRAELTKTRRELQDLQAKATSGAAAAERVPAWMAERIQRLTKWQAVNTAQRAEMQALRIERLRLKEELSMRVGAFSWGEAWDKAQQSLVSAWNHEVFSVQDQPVRVRTVLAVILMLFAGYWLSSWISEVLAGRVLRRIGLNTGRRAAWQTLSFYALFLLVVLAAFNLFHLSLTQFSVVSGALAVGLGFGSQNLLSNFISGIILLVERPVNKGDVIEIEGQQVTVEKLGPRSTIVRSNDNTHMIVPNSRLLEQSVTNWTLTDEIVRRRINVGVAYGSPTRQVDRVLREVLASVEDVRKNPAPTVTFTDFGDNALVFQALFYCEVADRVDVETELRHRISEAFARAGIVMAFPQRDIHLDTAKPLQVEMISPGAPRRD